MYIDISRVLLLVAIWGPIGPLVGIVAGHYLLKGWQREQWLVEARKQEFKELLTALTLAFTHIASSHISMRVYTPEEQIASAESWSAALRTIKDRIYIADVMDQLDVLNRWTTLDRAFDHNRDREALRNSFNSLNKAIVDAAVNDLYPPTKWWWRRKSK